MGKTLASKNRSDQYDRFAGINRQRSYFGELGPLAARRAAMAVSLIGNVRNEGDLAPKILDVDYATASRHAASSAVVFLMYLAGFRSIPASITFHGGTVVRG